MVWQGAIDKTLPPATSPVKYWLLATVKCILQFSHVIGLSGCPEKALLLEPMLTYETHTLFDQHGDQSLGATLALI